MFRFFGVQQIEKQTWNHLKPHRQQRFSSAKVFLNKHLLLSRHGRVIEHLSQLHSLTRFKMCWSRSVLCSMLVWPLKSRCFLTGRCWKVWLWQMGGMLISGEKAYFPGANWGSFLEFGYKWSSESGMRWPSRQRMLTFHVEQLHPDGSLISSHWKFSSKWRDPGWCVLGGFPFWPKKFGRFLITNNISIYVGYHFFKGTSRDHHFRASTKGSARCMEFWWFGIEVSGLKQYNTLAWE